MGPRDPRRVQLATGAKGLTPTPSPQVVTQVLAGEGVGWLKLNRLKKLMEDESYRNLVLSKLNGTLDKKIGPEDKVDDVVSRGGRNGARSTRG